jgi:1,4-dihydroxy-2-naphthoyl-CoA synthase
MSKVLKFARVKEEEPTVVSEILDQARDSDFTSIVILGEDGQGWWHFRCSGGINKVDFMGRLEFIKQEIFQSMGAKPE